MTLDVTLSQLIGARGANFVMTLSQGMSDSSFTLRSGEQVVLEDDLSGLDERNPPVGRIQTRGYGLLR